MHFMSAFLFLYIFELLTRSWFSGKVQSPFHQSVYLLFHDTYPDSTHLLTFWSRAFLAGSG